MESQKLITIQLTEEDARLFVEFKKHQTQFRQLERRSVFKHFIGQITIHKNGNAIKRIDILTIDQM